MKYIFLLLLAVSGALAASGSDITVISSTPAGVRFVYTVPQFQVSDHPDPSAPGQVVEVSGCAAFTVPGLPLVPVRRVFVGIPWGGTAGVRIETDGMSGRSGVLLAPAPEEPTERGQTRAVYRPDPEVYGQSRLFPQTQYADQVTVIRHQQVLQIDLYPVRHNPAARSLATVGEITVTVTFDGTAPSAGVVRSDPAYERLYHDLLLNYTVCRPWRWTPGPGLRPRTAAAAAADQWYSFNVQEEGIYKITYDQLTDAGITAPSADAVHFFASSGRELSRKIPAGVPVLPQDSLAQVPVYCSDRTAFGPGDYFLVYARGPVGWHTPAAGRQPVWFRNRYDTDNTYWIAVNNGRTPLAMDTIASGSGDSVVVLSAITGGVHLEDDQEYFYDHPGYKINKMDWYWERLTDNTFVTPGRMFQLTNADLAQPVTLDIRFIRSAAVTVRLNGITTGLSSGTQYEQTSVWSSTTGQIQLASSDNILDWMEAWYRCSLDAASGAVSGWTDTTGTVTYTVSGVPGGQTAWLFDLTDEKRVTCSRTISSGGQSSFTVGQHGLRRWMATGSSGFKTVDGIQAATRGGLLADPGGEYLVITPTEFKSEAARLAAFRQQHNDDISRAVVVTLDEIYTDFSGGREDITAIRDFLLYAAYYWPMAPAWAVLLGDGHYDYRHLRASRTRGESRCWIPAPVDTSGDSCKDDWFITTGSGGQVMGLGRLPVHSLAALTVVVDKIVNYESGIDNGLGWKNRIVIVADDEYNPDSGSESEAYHTNQAETLSKTVPGLYSISKLYMTEYEKDLLGYKPEANEDFIEEFNRGALILNYTGHGAPDIIAHEWLFRYSTDFSRVNNGSRLPIFLAASCNVGRFDNYKQVSMAEGFMTASGKGSIASIAGSRDTNGNLNSEMNIDFFSRLFNDTTMNTIGIALQYAKTNPQHHLYNLFGDPALKVAVPEYRVVIDTVSPETLKALATVRVSGYVERDGTFWNGFDGDVFLEVFDAVKDVTYTGSEVTLSYTMPGGHLFKGSGEVTDGRFAMSFIVPKDITYQSNGGKISAYAYGSAGEAVGYRDSVFIGGTATGLAPDRTGPEITMGLRHYTVETYDAVSNSPTLLVQLKDVSGLNITGQSGHTMRLDIDGDPELAEDLTAQFVYDKNSCTEGGLAFTLYDLASGPHTLSLKVWDNQNNSSTAGLSFTVVSEKDFAVLRPLNYPNPFSYRQKKTTITYTLNLEANHQDGVKVRIYTVAGRLLRELSGAGADVGYNQVEWDGRDRYGNWIANGTYMYVITAKREYWEGLVKKESVARATGFAVIRR